MTRNFEYGTTPKEHAIGRHAMTKREFSHRVEHKKVYPCASCNEPLTIFEHTAFIFMCKRCAEGGAAHYNRTADGKIERTNRYA